MYTTIGKKLVVLVVLAGLIWTGTAVWAKDKSEPKKLEIVYPDGSKSGDKKKAHYEVTEKYMKDGGLVEAEKAGAELHSFGSGYVGPNCSTGANVNSETAFTGYNSMQIENQVAKTSVNVKWNRGKENAPEPDGGVNIYYHHNSVTYAEAAGAGVKDIVGTSYGKAEARTQGPGGGTYSKSEAYAPAIGLRTDPSGQSATFSVKGAKDGHKDFLTSETNATASSMVFGTATGRAEAQVVWKAEINKKQKKEKKDDEK